MPAYNEEENIENVIAHWHPVAEKIGGESRLVIFNDGSTDKTYEKIRECHKKYPRLIGINKKNEGETKMKLGNLISKKESKHVVKQTNVQSGG